MGSSKYDPRDHINNRQGAAASGSTAFQFTVNAQRGGPVLHPSLDPAYGGKRRSQDLQDGTQKVPVVIILDETGSRTEDCRKNYDQMPKLCALLTGMGWLKQHKLDLQIIATGDAYTDRAPLQISQFEGDGPTIDKWLSRVYLEGGGGGTTEENPLVKARVSTETYELAMWALVHQNELDCWKHGQKGFAFFMLDEAPYSEVNADQLLSLYTASGPAPETTGDGVELSVAMRAQTISDLKLPTANIPLKEMADAVLKKYHVFGITSNGSGHYNDQAILGVWRKLFGEEAIIQLPDGNDMPELIASIMARAFGASTAAITQDLTTLNSSSSAIQTVSTVMARRDAAAPLRGATLALSGQDNGVARL